MYKKISNWGNYPTIRVKETYFSSTEMLRASIKQMSESTIPRGNGRCYGDASLGTHALSSLAYDHVLSFDPDQGIFECESGVILEQILDIIVPQGWFLPVTPGTKYISIGGAVASDVHGKNHHAEGSFCDHVLEMDIMLSSGAIKTCSPHLNPELFEATRGGMGLTGVILRVKFQLKKIASSFIHQVQVKADNLYELMDLFTEYQDFTYTMSWIDCLKGGKNFGRSILMAGEHAKPDELNTSQQKKRLSPQAKKLFTLPLDLPSFLLNQYSVKAFNHLYYHNNMKKQLHNVVSYDSFFYPLDKIHDWNKGYGKQGFLQYQFVLPMESSKEGMIQILEQIHKKGMGSFLAVFKVFGHQNNLISFPMKGCTLALDFPVRKSLFPFLDELDRIVLDYGGRLYLTKDARMKPETFWKSYPGAPKFQQLIKKYNPDYTFRSLLSDRLKITS